MAAKVTDTDRGARAAIDAAKALARYAVRVGILADAPKKTGTRTGKRGRQIQQAATLAEVAAAHEFGTDKIPQRSFIRATMDLHRADIMAMMSSLVALVVAGKIDARTACERLGIYAQGLVQARIAEGIAPELAPSTIARKGSSKQLVDSGQLRSSITYQITGG